IVAKEDYVFKKKEKLTKFFFATDIHGSEKCWLKLVNSGAFYEVDTIILGGDMTGKGIQAILEETPGVWKTNFLGEEIEVNEESGLAKVESKVRNAGFYPHRFKPDEFNQFANSEEVQERIFKLEMNRVIQGCREIAEKQLKGTGRRILVTAGNGH